MPISNLNSSVRKTVCRAGESQVPPGSLEATILSQQRQETACSDYVNSAMHRLPSLSCISATGLCLLPTVEGRNGHLASTEISISYFSVYFVEGLCHKFLLERSSRKWMVSSDKSICFHIYEIENL